MGKISIGSARTKNLQSITCEIPLKSLTIVSGPSGSGKSALVFDSILWEVERREQINPIRTNIKSISDPELGNSRFDYLRGIGYATGLSCLGESLINHSVSEVLNITRSISQLFLTVDKSNDLEQENIYSVSRVVELIQDSIIDNELIIACRLIGTDYLEQLKKLLGAGLSRVLCDGKLKLIEEELDQFEDEVYHNIFAVIDIIADSSVSSEYLYQSVSLAAESGDGKVCLLKGKEKFQLDTEFTVRTFQNQLDIPISEGLVAGKN